MDEPFYGADEDFVSSAHGWVEWEPYEEDDDYLPPTLPGWMSREMAEEYKRSFHSRSIPKVQDWKKYLKGRA